MLTLLYPQLLPYLQGFDYGLIPINLPEENRRILAIKCTKEIILTASLKNEFRLYLLSDPEQEGKCLGLVSAFFDDHDEPLTITTPLFSNDSMLKDIKELFSQENFDVFFFDENNFEMLGSRAVIPDFDRINESLEVMSFSDFQANDILQIWQKFEHQFAIRTCDDDTNSFQVRINERLYDSNVSIADLRENFFGFNDNQENIAFTSLRRDGNSESGAMQEKDIARLLRRLFEADEVFLNPFRADELKENKRELVDLLIITENVMIFVQAKDSPNKEDILNRTINRKRTTIRRHIEKATAQVKGALCYARDHDGVTIFIDHKPVRIDLNGRQIVGIVVVKELFDDDYLACSLPVLNLVRELELPISLLDYPQLHVLTQNFKSPSEFVNGLFRALDMALESEQFPKSVFSKKY